MLLGQANGCRNEVHVLNLTMQIKYLQLALRNMRNILLVSPTEYSFNLKLAF